MDNSNNDFDNDKNEETTKSKTNKVQFENKTTLIDEKFAKAAEAQVIKVLKELNILGEISGKHQGKYTEEQVELIFNALKRKTSSVRKQFKIQKDDDSGFSLID
jgi:hypothetical protein